MSIIPPLGHPPSGYYYHIYVSHLQEEFEDIKGIITIHKRKKDRQDNGQKESNKDQQTITQKTKDLVTRTLLKWWLSVYTVRYNHFLYNHFRNVSAMQQYNLKKIFFLKLQHKQLPQVKYFRSSKQQTTVPDQILQIV